MTGQCVGRPQAVADRLEVGQRGLIRRPGPRQIVLAQGQVAQGFARVGRSSAILASHGDLQGYVHPSLVLTDKRAVSQRVVAA